MIGSAAESILEKITNKESLERADLRDLVAQSRHPRECEIVPLRPRGSQFGGS